MTWCFMVVAKDLTRRFVDGARQITAVDQASFTIHRGEVVAIVGPSGSGKTTLLSLLGALLPPSSGRLTIMGADLAELCGEERILFRRRTIGFVFQQFRLLEALSAIDNVMVPLIASGIPYRDAVEIAICLLEELAIVQFVGAYPRELSGGQKQRVAIARALVTSPQVVICDEPTSALDTQTAEHVTQVLLAAASRRQTTVILVTHDERIAGHAHRVLRMRDGRIT